MVFDNFFYQIHLFILVERSRLSRKGLLILEFNSGWGRRLWRQSVCCTLESNSNKIASSARYLPGTVSSILRALSYSILTTKLF